MNALTAYLRYLVLACIFIIPFLVLYVSSNTFFPYIVGKNFAFRILTEVAFGGWLMLVALGALPRPKVSPIAISIGAFLLIVGLANAFGVAPFKSFWSNFERMDGFITLLHAAAFFLVAGNMLNTRKLWRRFWQVSLVVSIFVGMSALGELGKEGARIAGTTGNPIYLAVYALFHTFIAALFAYRVDDDKVVRWLYVLVAVFNIAILWFTGTRGSLIGLLAGVIVTALSIVLFGKGQEYASLRKLALGGIFALVLLGGMLVALKDTDFAKQNTMMQRLATLTQTDESDRSTGALRLMVWRTALKGVAERPILGWGQENFNYVFNKHYNPKMYWAEQWYDRTHNILLDWLIAAGILGLLGYLSVYATIFISIIRIEYFSLVEKSILVGLLAAYGVHNLFVFDHVISYILFFAFAAWLYALGNREKEDGSYDVSNVSNLNAVHALAIVGITVVTIATMYSANYTAIIQNKTLLQALVAVRQDAGIEKGLELFTQATTYKSTGTQEAREQFTQAASGIAAKKGIDTQLKTKFVNTAIVQMQDLQEGYPNDARFPYFLGTLYSRYGEYDKAQEAFTEALELSPTKIGFMSQLSALAQARGDTKAVADYNAQIKALQE